ncbi:MAG: tetratricopeptide repeat protein [bacterium]
MLICDNCGNTIPDGRKFCGKCGTPAVPLASAPEIPNIPGPPPAAFKPGPSIGLEPDGAGASGMEMFDPSKDRRTGEKITGLGFSQESAQQAEFAAREAQKLEKLKPKQNSQPEPPAETAALPDDEEAFVAAMLAEAADKKKKKRKKLGPIYKEPVFWLALGTLLLLPALALPWFYFYDGEPLSAFRLPVIFLFTDRVYMAPWLTVGSLIAAVFAINLALTIYPKRIVTFMQALAFISILLTAGTLLLGLRHLNAKQGIGPVYDQYLQNRAVALPNDPLPQLQLIKKVEMLPASGTAQIPNPVAPGRPPIVARQTANPAAGQVVVNGAPGKSRLVTPGELAAVKHVQAGKAATSWLGFFLSVTGAGMLFTLLSALVIFRTARRYANKFKHIEIQIPESVGALMIVAGTVMLVLFLFARISPARWYYSENALLRMAGRPDAGEKRLKVCIEVQAPDYLCRKALAKSYWEQNKLKDALALYLGVIKEQPEFPDARLDLGNFYYNSKDYWRATDQYRRYLSYRPSDMKARDRFSKSLIYIGNQHSIHHRHSKAAAAYEEALKALNRNKSDPVLQLKAGEAYLQVGRYGDAVAHLAVSADLQPQNFDLQIKVAKLYEARRELEKALVYYKKAIAARQDQTIAYIYIGNLYRDRYRDKEKAREWYRKGIDANPVNDAAPAARKALENLQ